jgi:hypothetical protein
MTRLILLCVMVGIVSPALAWTEPDGWRIRWGESEQALMQKGGVYCFNVDSLILPPRACSLEDSAAPLRTVWRFRAGGLAAVHLYVSRGGFETLRDTLVERFGSPTLEEVEEKRDPAREEVEQWPPPSYRPSRTFVRYRNRIVKWHGERVQMYLEEHPDGRLSDSEARIILTDELRRQYR